jgi:hypothetical protein
LLIREGCTEEAFYIVVVIAKGVAHYGIATKSLFVEIRGGT